MLCLKALDAPDSDTDVLKVHLIPTVTTLNYLLVCTILYFFLVSSTKKKFFFSCIINKNFFFIRIKVWPRMEVDQSTRT